MTRAAVPGLPSRYPLGGLLPALYADDSLAQRITAGLDTLLAPVLSALDNLPAYFDPALAPADFVAWLASWVGSEIDPMWPEELRRTVVARAIELHRWRGTRRGLAERLWLCFGAGTEISDGGGATWSISPRSPLPDAPSGELLVRVWPVRVPTLNRDQVVAVVEASRPVHLACRVELLSSPPTDGGD